jgi:hypothetical protein
MSVFEYRNVKIDSDHRASATFSPSGWSPDSPYNKTVYSTHFIMAKGKPCYCPNCNGAMRAATTVKKHAAKAAEVEAANLIRQKAQERVRQRGNNGGEFCEGDNERDFTSSQEEEAGERPNKRCRTDSEAPDLVGLVSIKCPQYIH